MKPNPCVGCGACCTRFRVSFYRGEAIPGPGAVPEDLVVEVSPFRVAMRGTEGPPHRCAALQGEIGTGALCGIHPLRPSVCREFDASWVNGVHEPRCDASRIAYGMAPLTPDDWLEAPSPARRPRVA